MRDAWRLAVGTFTAVRVPAPTVLDGRTLGRGLLLAPLTTVVFLVGWVPLGIAAARGIVPGPVAAGLAVVGVALGTRAVPLDGRADLADGLASGHDPDRSLEVMRRGDTGPAGAVAIVLALGVEGAALSTLLTSAGGLALAGTALLASRLAPAVCAVRGTPAARTEGLGHAVAGTVTRTGALVVAIATAAVGALAAGFATGLSSFWAPVGCAVAVVLAAVAASVAVRRHAVRRLGGITGDVLGAAVEIALATALVTATVVVALTRAPIA